MDMTKLRQKESTGKEDYVKVVFLWPLWSHLRLGSSDQYALICLSSPLCADACVSV